MSKQDFNNHHIPRNNDKKKHHKRGFNEDVDFSRKTRVNFKNYLRELEEKLLEDDLDDSFDEKNLTDEDKEFIVQDFISWSGDSPENCGDDILQDYAYEIAPKEFDPQEVLYFLRNYTGE